MRESKLAFGITREELSEWKDKVSQGEIAFITHYWYDPRFPQYSSVTKVGCASIPKLVDWGRRHDLKEKWIHQGKYPHFDLLGPYQYNILQKEGLHHHIVRFNLKGEQ